MDALQILLFSPYFSLLLPQKTDDVSRSSCEAGVRKSTSLGFNELGLK